MLAYTRNLLRGRIGLAVAFGLLSALAIVAVALSAAIFPTDVIWNRPTGG